MTESEAGPKGENQLWQRRVAISASTKINPTDFGLSWTSTLETGVILVGDEVILTLEVEFVSTPNSLSLMED